MTQTETPPTKQEYPLEQADEESTRAEVLASTALRRRLGTIRTTVSDDLSVHWKAKGLQ